MNIAPIKIKEALAIYEQEAQSFNNTPQFCLIYSYNGIKTTYLIKNKVHWNYINGVYVLTSDGLYFTQSKYIIFNQDNLVTDKQVKLLEVAKYLHKDSHKIKKIVKKITGHVCPKEAIIITKLKALYNSIISADHATSGNLTIAELHTLLHILLPVDLYFYPPPVQKAIAHLFNTLISMRSSHTDFCSHLRCLISWEVLTENLLFCLMKYRHWNEFDLLTSRFVNAKLLTLTNIESLTKQPTEFTKLLYLISKVRNLDQKILDFIFQQPTNLVEKILAYINIAPHDYVSAIIDVCILLFQVNLLHQDTETIITNILLKHTANKPELVIQEVLLQCIINYCNTMLFNPAYYELFTIAKQTGHLSNADFIQWFEYTIQLAPPQMLEYMFSHKNIGWNKTLCEEFVQCLPLLSDEQFLTIFNQNVYGNTANNIFLSYFTKLSSIQIYDGGTSKDNWWKICYQTLKRLPAPKYKPNQFFMRMEQVILPEVAVATQQFWQLLQQANWQFTKLQGRTILLTNTHGEILAIKVQKYLENVAELIKEYQATYTAKKYAAEYGLIGKYANPIGIVTLTSKQIEKLIHLPKSSFDASAFHTLTGFQENHDYYAYLYQLSPANAGYNIYLHDPNISTAASKASHKIAITDLSIFLGLGVVFDRLADLFHNTNNSPNLAINPIRPDLGYYIYLTNLLAPTQFMRSEDERDGSGRVTAWQKSVEYPNLRLEHVADLGDFILITDLQHGGAWFEKHFKFTELKYGATAGNYVLANMLAEYLYVLMLIAGYRAYLLQQADPATVAEIWQTAAEQVLENCITMVSQLSYKPTTAIRDTLVRICDQTRLARQMQFWMTNEYIAYLQANTIPSDIYDDTTKIDVNINRFRANTFSADKGCSINGIDPDLGTVNGQEPIKEANKLIYWTITLITAAFLEFKLILQDVLKIFATTDATIKSTIEQAFTYTTPLLSSKLKKDLYNLAAEKSINQQVALEYKQLSTQHEYVHNVLTIQYCWRRKLAIQDAHKLAVTDIKVSKIPTNTYSY